MENGLGLACRPMTPIEPDLDAYRHAVEELLKSIDYGDTRIDRADAMVAEALEYPEIVSVLASLPGGIETIKARMRAEVHDYEPNLRSSAIDLNAMVRILFLSQIDTLWWGHLQPFETDVDLQSSTELVDLDPLRRAGKLHFSYRRQSLRFSSRARDSLIRRVAPTRAPATAGLRFARTRPEAIVLMNEVATAFAKTAPRGTPQPWATSMARSVEHQHRLRDLGYSALLPSGHCVGYAIDVEMTWFGQFGAIDALETVLLAMQGRGEVNVIDEGQAWHVCISPAESVRLQRVFHEQFGG